MVIHAPSSSSAPRPRTGLQNNISKIKDFRQDILRYDPQKRGFLASVTPPASEDSEPISHTAALQSPHWKQTMNEEFAALMKNGTWDKDLVPSQPSRNLVDCKWIFKVNAIQMVLLSAIRLG